MRDWRIALGVVIGLAATGGTMSLSSWRPVRTDALPSAGPTLSDCDGPLRELVMHYTTESAALTATPYRQFLTALSPRVTVHIVCGSQDDWRDFRERFGDLAVRVKPIVVNHAITCWSRDRWLALREGHRTTLLTPRGENGQSSWPRRAGDGRVAARLAGALGGVCHLRCDLYFDGGDCVADRHTAFITPKVTARNTGLGVKNAAELHRRLTDALGRRVILLDSAPPYHAGMYMMPIGQNRMLVGDPSLAAGVLDDQTQENLLPCGTNTSAEMQARFDAVANACRREGYRVTRIPTLIGTDGRTFLTWVNVIIEQRGRRRIVYMPVFDQAGPLNQKARRIWESLGYDVQPIDCTSSYRHFGSLRCLVSVLRRGET
jgi:hypothetical protein